jgi:hypothetical protein
MGDRVKPHARQSCGANFAERTLTITARLARTINLRTMWFG